MDNELHISSLIIHGKTTHNELITSILSQLPGMEIHGTNDQGKFVVTLETFSEKAIVDCIDRINQIDGVLSTVMVYHHSEDLASLEEEMNDESDSPRVY